MTSTQAKNPHWWTEDHSSSWERVKAALRRDWEQTKADVSHAGHDLDQDAKDTIQQAAGKQPIPPGNMANPPASWEEAEPALRYGHGARLYYSSQRAGDRDWDPELESSLKEHWEASGNAGPWERVKAAVRRGWDSAKLTAASTHVPLF
jgi:hypothetical protein